MEQLDSLENITQEQLNDKMKELKRLEKELSDERNLIEIQKGLLEKQQRKNLLLKKQLDNQKILFDKQWQLLETETRRLAADKDKFDREKRIYRDQVYREARRSMSVASNTKIMFKGVDDTDSLKKRYKELIKIYHPDNSNGDTELIKAITDQYEELKRFYLGS
ncbi:MAG: hypothetical protein ACI4EV_08625 [Lachnospiraceae bacterium]